MDGWMHGWIVHFSIKDVDLCILFIDFLKLYNECKAAKGLTKHFLKGDPSAKFQIFDLNVAEWTASNNLTLTSPAQKPSSFFH